MTVSDFRRLLEQYPQSRLHFMLPSGEFVPEHFHVTEVGRIQKDFMDCGGTTRHAVTCLLQLWVANDLDHRLVAEKLASILNMAAPLLRSEDLPVEIEYEGEIVSQFPLTAAEVTPAGLLFHLGTKHTDCLAPNRCKVPGTSGAVCC